jgi:uncharacterized protein (DUF433 family)
MTELFCSLLSFEGRTSMRFDRITIDPMVATGKPCIRNPYLESPDIDEALRYAAYLAEDETIELSR